MNKNYLKNKLTIVLFSALIIALSVSAKPQEKTTIEGTWRLYIVAGSGTQNPANKMERKMIFNHDNVFYGTFINQGSRRPYNRGFYYLINSWKIVMVNADFAGNPEKAGNVYDYRIYGDTLHLDGYYFRKSPMDTMVYFSIPINEIWIREK